jgi:hypothetical protein
VDDAEFEAMFLRLPPRKQAQMVANAFVVACQEGGGCRVRQLAEWLSDLEGGWLMALKEVVHRGSVHPDARVGFETRWKESRSLMRHVRDRRLMVDALRVLFPPVQLAGPMQLYRGTSSRERPCRGCGLSWTTEIEIARNFAAPPHPPGHHGIILTTLAEPGAILLISEDRGDEFDEGEVIVDPFRLGKVTEVT